MRLCCSIPSFLDRLRNDRSGQDMIEYALMAAFIAVAVAVVFPRTIAPNIMAIFSKLNDHLAAL